MEVSSSSTTRKGYFIEEEEEEDSCLSEMEAWSYKKMNYPPQSYYSVSSPRSFGKFNDFRFDHSSYGFGQPQQPLAHFLESCSLCKKRLGDNRDIFMYRGDTPFCSEECREEQIKKDEAKEKKQNLSSSVKAMRSRKEKRSSSSSPTRSRDYAFHPGTVAAA